MDTAAQVMEIGMLSGHTVQGSADKGVAVHLLLIMQAWYTLLSCLQMAY